MQHIILKLVCLAIFLVVSSEGKRCHCKNHFKQVCGTDGITYKNPCKLKCAGIKLKHTGACKTVQVSDVTTSVQYSSIMSRGSCGCPFILEPVCGADEITYPNSCAMRCAGTKEKYPGRCRTGPRGRLMGSPSSTCSCPLNHKPVCGSDERTYTNECVLDCAGVRLLYPGKCSKLARKIKSI